VPQPLRSRAGPTTSALQPAKFAGVLVIDGDPLSDIRVLQSPSHLAVVVKAGVRVDIDTPIPERHERSWERNKVHLQGRFRYDDRVGRGCVLP
jgi:hypothetical protein